LFNEYSIICFEYLDINNIVENHCLAKSIMDCTWGKLVLHTLHKAESAGRIVVLADPRNTSKMCSRCGVLVESRYSTLDRFKHVRAIYCGPDNSFTLFS
jgi:putative transposase